MPDPVDLAQLFENAPGYIAVVRGPDHVFEVTNAAYRDLVGKGDLLGKSVRDAMPELADQGYIKLLDEVFASGKPYRADRVPVLYDVSPTEKVKRYISFIYQPIFDDSRKVTGIFAEGIDVTPPVEAEQAQRETQARLDAFFNQTATGVTQTDMSGRFLRVNPRFCEITGRTPEELLELTMQEITHPEDLTGNIPLFTRALETGGSFDIEKRYLRPDGSSVWVHNSVTAITDQSGAAVGTICVTIDATDRKEAELALRESRDDLAEESRALETLNETGASIAAELDTAALVQRVVDAGVDLTGAAFGAFFYNVEDEAGEWLTLYSLSGADKSAFEHFGMPRPTGVFAPTFHNEGIVRSGDITKDPRYGLFEPHRGMPKGHLPVCSYLAVPVVSRSGEVIGGLFFGHPEPDVFTERSEKLMVGLAAQAAIGIDNARLFEAAQRAKQRLEQRVVERTKELQEAHEALRQAQKMEAIGQLTGGIAHDFNNLLTVIRGSADLLRTRDLSEEKRRRYVDAISDTADRAAKLTGQLLAFARRQALKPEVFDAADRVAGITDMLRTVLGSRIRLDIDVGCPDCFVEADAGQFETALVNMSVNSRDAMDGEGELRIRIEKRELAQTAGDLPPGDYVAVEVADTGHGIAADQLDRVFEPFYTTKDVGKGTGLGLSQVYGFVKQSGGDILVESEVGRGTAFTLLLPKADPIARPAEKQEERPERPEGKGRILVVEDNAQVGEFATQLLSDLGFETRFAPDAQQALEILESEEAKFDVVFTDVVMPGMSGVDFAAAVKQRWPDMPVVLTSGYSHVLAAGAPHGLPLLHKPYSVESIARILREALR
ncbi:MAG TPA: PAS domain S-box protein [Allosphingosinicella sp.]|jgi:PAS domain S-box-containing protein